MGQSRPLFRLFSFFSSYNFNNTNWKKHWWCAWDSNPGPQYGRRRQNHGSMAATLFCLFALVCTPQLIQLQSYRGNGELYFKGHNWLWNCWITEFLFLAFLFCCNFRLGLQLPNWLKIAYVFNICKWVLPVISKFNVFSAKKYWIWAKKKTM